MTEGGTGAESSPADEELLGRLRSVLQRLDPVPAGVTTVARSLLSWRDPDARLAELVADTRELTSTVRGDPEVILRFRAGDVEIDVQFSASGEGFHRLVGQVDPAEAGSMVIRRGTEQSEVPVDELGRFAAERLPPGPISLRWRPMGRGATPIDTAWQLL